MPAQYDFIAGLDISSLSSVTQAQLMQMINQVAPLSNIGGVIYAAATSSSQSIAQGTLGSPDVSNNPRFARYLWLNTFTTLPTPFYYDTSDSKWKVVTVANASVAAAQLAGHVTALDHMFNTVGADGNLSDRVLVYDATGTLITQISKADLFATISVLLTQISTSGSAVTNVIKNVAGTVSWAKINLATDSFDGTLPLTKLASGTADYLMKMVVGTPTWVSNDDAVGVLFPTGTAAIGISPAKLKAGAANQMVVTNSVGTGVSWVNQSLRVGTINVISISGTFGGALSNNSYAWAHGFTSLPKLVRIVAVLSGSDTTSLASATYASGDEVDVLGLRIAGELPAYSICVDAANITISYRTTTAPAILICSKDGAQVVGGLNEALWQFKAYAWQ